MDKTAEELFAEDTKDLVENPTPLSVAMIGGLGIQGLEDVPSSILPIPYLRLIQPSSQKTETSKGKEAVAGTFYFNDTKTEYESVTFALIKAKYGMQSFERDGEMKESVKLALLGMTLDTNKLFIITLSVMSFTSFGSLVAQMKEAKMKSTWEKAITVTSEKQENDKGKYYVAKFELGDDLTQAQIHNLASKHQEFGTVLDRKDQQASEVTL